MKTNMKSQPSTYSDIFKMRVFGVLECVILGILKVHKSMCILVFCAVPLYRDEQDAVNWDKNLHTWSQVRRVLRLLRWRRLWPQKKRLLWKTSALGGWQHGMLQRPYVQSLKPHLLSYSRPSYSYPLQSLRRMDRLLWLQAFQVCYRPTEYEDTFFGVNFYSAPLVSGVSWSVCLSVCCLLYTSDAADE